MYFFIYIYEESKSNLTKNKLTMTLKSNLFIAILTFLGCFLLLALRPVPASSLQNVKSTTGKIVKVSEDVHSNTVLIKLSNDGYRYSLDKGTGNDFDFEDFRNNLLYRKATLDFLGPVTVLKGANQIIPIARLTVSGQTFWQRPKAKFVAN